ncbi:MAG: Flp family type IVb pilin, partial [Chloroflexota bacterium]
MKTFKRFESGQAFVEYALISALVAIAALVMLTLFADPNDWRNGVIYKSVYRPVQCAVQGISRDNCANDDATLAAIRFPAVGSGNSRKLCSRSVGENPIRDGSEVWSSCLTGSTNNSGSSGPVEVVGITHVDITNGGSGELEQDEELEESTW